MEMKKSRLEMMKQLAELETNLEHLKLLKEDIDNSYADGIVADFEIGGTIFHRVYKGQAIFFNKNTLSDFLADELLRVSGDVRKLMIEIMEYK